ncbi:MAG TPA: gas vesicle protein GvpG [Trebonia sp.]|nr:gas vesicle protein GvpG [Trebonia sp.]
MGLLTLLPRLPFLPIQVTIRIAELIQEETERELRDPARVRRQLEDAERQHAIGSISEDELSRIEYTATGRLLTGEPGNRRQPTTGDDRNG